MSDLYVSYRYVPLLAYSHSLRQTQGTGKQASKQANKRAHTYTHTGTIALHTLHVKHSLLDVFLVHLKPAIFLLSESSFSGNQLQLCEMLCIYFEQLQVWVRVLRGLSNNPTPHLLHKLFTSFLLVKQLLFHCSLIAMCTPAGAKAEDNSYTYFPNTRHYYIIYTFILI